MPRPTTFVASADVLASATVEIAGHVEEAVFSGRQHADRALSAQLRRRRDLAPGDARFVSQATFALFRWRGWVEELGPRPLPERLLWSVLLDAPIVPAPCRYWARMIDYDPKRLSPLGDAPDWKSRSEGLRRQVNNRYLDLDPWRLFPPWFPKHLPLPPGPGSPKLRKLAMLQFLQTRPPLWVRTQGKAPGAIWDELRGLGVQPSVHSRVPSAASLDADIDVYHLPPFERGELEIQDLAAQAVGLVCDPDPGERWWDVCAGAGGKALHLADLMRGKGVVVASDIHETKLKETVRRARRSPFRNLTTNLWDGKHAIGKRGSFDGVLVDAPCSAIGTWRRNPDARWSLPEEAIDRLTALQLQLLSTAAGAVHVGGALIYSVCTWVPNETVSVVRAFLEMQPQFRLDRFPHPLTGSETDGTLLVWPNEANSDAMFIARMIRTE